MKLDFEQRTFFEKIKEFKTLFIFTCFSAVFAVILADFLVFPIALFATSNKKAFSYLCCVCFFALIILCIVFSVLKKFFYYKKNGASFLQCIKFYFKEKISSFASIFSLFILAVFVIAFIYVILNFNYYFLYELMN